MVSNMIPPPFTELEVKTAPSGLYEGYSLPIALISKISMALLVIWALVWPLNANGMLSSINGGLLQGFNAYYIVAVGGFAFFYFLVAVIPSTGRRLLGREGEEPEFSTFF